MFDPKKDAGAKPNSVNWSEIFSGCPKIHNVANSSQLRNALAKLNPYEGIRLASGAYELGGETLRSAIPNIVIGPATAGGPTARQVKVIGGQFIITGESAVIGGMQFSAPKARGSMLQLNAPRVTLVDFDLDNIIPPGAKSRVIAVGTAAKGALIANGHIIRTSGFVVVLDSPKRSSAAQNVTVRNNTFVACPGYYFQAGQWGNLNDNAHCDFIHNKIIDCAIGQSKVSHLTCKENYFSNVYNGFALRYGEYNVLDGNVFEGGRWATRIFGKHHTIKGNSIAGTTKYSIALMEGSLQDQFGALPNAHHVSAEDISIINNTVVHGEKTGIYIGVKQTGRLGTGKKYAPNPSSPDWPHYEPYSPSIINISANTFYGEKPKSVVLRKPDTEPNTRDRYPKNPRLNAYVDVFVAEDNIYRGA